MTLSWCSIIPGAQAHFPCDSNPYSKELIVKHFPSTGSPATATRAQRPLLLALSIASVLAAASAIAQEQSPPPLADQAG